MTIGRNAGSGSSTTSALVSDSNDVCRDELPHRRRPQLDPTTTFIHPAVFCKSALLRRHFSIGASLPTAAAVLLEFGARCASIAESHGLQARGGEPGRGAISEVDDHVLGHVAVLLSRVEQPRRPDPVGPAAVVGER